MTNNIEYITRAELEAFKHNKGISLNDVDKNDIQLMESLIEKFKYFSTVIKKEINGTRVKNTAPFWNPVTKGKYVKNYLWYRIFPSELWSKLEVSLVFSFKDELTIRVDSDNWKEGLLKREKIKQLRKTKVFSDSYSIDDILSFQNYDNFLSKIILFYDKELYPNKNEIINIAQIKIGLISSKNLSNSVKNFENQVGFKYFILWDNETPLGNNQTIKELKETIKRHGYTELYYVQDEFIKYRLKITALATTSHQLTKWKNQEEIDGFNNEISEFNNDSEYAKIVYCCSDFVKLDTEIHQSEYKLYRNFDYPKKNEVSPIILSNVNSTENKELGDEGVQQMNSQSELNQILFGPPGTGKTYNSIIKAVEIIEPSIVANSDFKQIKAKFDDLLAKEQIMFTTFHQSMSYEDFIEGIKPVPPIKDGHPVTYKVEDGIFKQICENAKSHKESNTFDKVYEKFVNDVNSVEDFELNTLHRTKPFQVKINSNNSCVAIPKTDVATNMVIKKSAILQYLTDGTIKDWKPYLTTISEHLKTKYDLKLDDISTVSKSYVIIIDEINRGNVSSIFGELITLIEESKRKGKGSNETLEIFLPYSKELFSVPNNLYIIGTMNTADRSVEALDSALRRRFSFTEMPPDSTLIQQPADLEVNLPELLTVINERLEILLDNDHLIGHSYFMKVTDLPSLRNAFYNEIIPLLQEYFFGDYGKISMVLGKDFCGLKENDKKIEFANVPQAYDKPDYDDKLVFEIKQVKGDDFIKAINSLLLKQSEDE